MFKLNAPVLDRYKREAVEILETLAKQQGLTFEELLINWRNGHRAGTEGEIE